MTNLNPETNRLKSYTVERGEWFSCDVMASSPQSAALTALERGHQNDPLHEYWVNADDITHVMDQARNIQFIQPTGDLYEKLDATPPPPAQENTLPEKEPPAREPATESIDSAARPGNSLARFKDGLKVDALLAFDVIERSPDWNDLDTEGGMKLLSEIEFVQAQEENRPSCKLELNPNASVEGSYDRERNTITLRSELLALSDIRPALRSLWQQQRNCSQQVAPECSDGRLRVATPDVLRNDQIVYAASRIKALEELQVERARAAELERETQPPEPGPVEKRRIHELSRELEKQLEQEIA